MTNASVVVVSIEDDGCMFSTRGECCFVHKSNMLRRRLASAARHVSAHSGDNPELIVEAECSWSKIASRVTNHGRTCLAVVGDGTSSQAERCLFELRKAGINCAAFTARGAYPTADGIDEARDMAKRIGADSIVGIGGGGALDSAKGAARLHTSNGACKHFLSSPSGVLMAEEGAKSEPRAPVGRALPLVMVPTSAGAGAGANGRCLVWHPEDEVLVPMAEAAGGGPVSVALVDPLLCASLSKEQTVAMALTALSSCVDALLAWELASAAGTKPKDESDTLLQLGIRGIGAVTEGLPVALTAGKSTSARELLTTASLCAGQLSAITPAPPTQLLARAAGSLLCRHSYPSVCATVFPHVVGDMLNQANSFAGDAHSSEAIERALSRAASALLGDGNDGQALISWLETQERDWLSSSSLSCLDSTLTAKEVAMNVEMLLALEEDTAAADRIWSGRGALDVAELVVG